MVAFHFLAKGLFLPEAEGKALVGAECKAEVQRLPAAEASPQLPQ